VNYSRKHARLNERVGSWKYYALLSYICGSIISPDLKIDKWALACSIETKTRKTATYAKHMPNTKFIGRIRIKY